MNNKLIYSFKANGCGCKVSGRVCATDMQDATRQVQAIIKQHGYGLMNVHMNQLKNQKAAMAKWLREHEDKELNAIADSRQGQKRVSVNLEDL